MRDQPILITGASGNVGREVVRALKAHHPEARLRIAHRTLDTGAAGLTEPAAEQVRLDFEAPETFSQAVHQCRSVFLLRPPAISNVKDTLNRFIDAARRAQVRRIVFLSVAGAGDNKLIPHQVVEAHLRRGPADWTILRPGFFAQNLSTAYREDIVRDDRLYVPAGTGKVAFVDLRDVGCVAAEALTAADQYVAALYTLTGPAAYSFSEVADLLSVHLNRAITYTPASIPGYVYHLLINRRQSLMHTLVQTVLHVGLRYGQAANVDPTLARLLGRQPHTVQTYIRDHRAVWRPAGKPQDDRGHG